jgi:hypothetical protein
MEMGAFSQFEDQFVSPAVMQAHLKVRTPDHVSIILLRLQTMNVSAKISSSM